MDKQKFDKQFCELCNSKNEAFQNAIFKLKDNASLTSEYACKLAIESYLASQKFVKKAF